MRMTEPKRIQRKRTKGWRMPPNAERRYRVRWADDGVLAIEEQYFVRGRWSWAGADRRREYRADRAADVARDWSLAPDGAMLPGAEW